MHLTTPNVCMTFGVLNIMFFQHHPIPYIISLTSTCARMQYRTENRSFHHYRRKAYAGRTICSACAVHIPLLPHPCQHVSYHMRLCLHTQLTTGTKSAADVSDAATLAQAAQASTAPANTAGTASGQDTTSGAPSEVVVIQQGIQQHLLSDAWEQRLGAMQAAKVGGDCLLSWQPLICQHLM